MSATLTVNATQYRYASLAELEQRQPGCITRLPYCLRVLAENVLRNQGNNDVDRADLHRLLDWQPDATEPVAVPFHPARVLMQDYTGIPTLVDLAALREGMRALGLPPERINPQIPVDLVIDHSLIVDQAGHDGALAFNLKREYERNAERYRLAKWATQSLQQLRVVPPGNGILHQINIEHIAQVVRVGGEPAHAFPDTMVGTDSHSTMVNGIGVLGWGVGGIEAEAAMLGLPLILPLRRVVGVRLSGALRPGVTATDIVLTLTQALRRFKVVDSLVEFFGPALATLSCTDRTTIANMAPEYGSTCAFFPVDDQTIRYLRDTGRPAGHTELVAAYCQAQWLWRTEAATPEYSAVLDFDLSQVSPCVAGPRRPQDRVELSQVAADFAAAFPQAQAGQSANKDAMPDGAVVVAAITSCTNTSNPAVMLGAALLARNARRRGLRPPPWVKASLTPGSRVVGTYLAQSGLQDDLDALGFNVAGYGCATCGGNSGRLEGRWEKEVEARGLVACAVLSGNRNFEARIHPLARANYLMSPPLVVAYALAGHIGLDLEHDALGHDEQNRPVYLRDIWPDAKELAGLLAAQVGAPLFESGYRGLFTGDAAWQALHARQSALFPWEEDSTYIRRPPYLDDFRQEPPRVADIAGARVLLMLGDSITTDHISPVGDIAESAPAGILLRSKGVARSDFNAYGSRRSNHEIMTRGTFANIRLRNELADGKEGGWTRHAGSGEILPIYDAAMRYQDEGVPLLVVAGKEYGSGSSRDWAAKGTRLLGVRAVLAESFERIHRSNLIMMGVLPLEFMPGETRLNTDFAHVANVDIINLAEQAVPGGEIRAILHDAHGKQRSLALRCRLDTENERKVWAGGGMMPFVLRKLAQTPAQAAPKEHKP